LNVERFAEVGTKLRKFNPELSQFSIKGTSMQPRQEQCALK